MKKENETKALKHLKSIDDRLEISNKKLRWIDGQTDNTTTWLAGVSLLLLLGFGILIIQNIFVLGNLSRMVEDKLGNDIYEITGCLEAKRGRYTAQIDGRLLENVCANDLDLATEGDKVGIYTINCGCGSYCLKILEPVQKNTECGKTP